MIAKWQQQNICSVWYQERWSYLLSLPIDEAEAIVMAPTDEGQMLRASIPIAGVFSQEELSFIQTNVS
jgi:hypothetical protein